MLVCEIINVGRVGVDMYAIPSRGRPPCDFGVDVPLAKKIRLIFVSARCMARAHHERLPVECDRLHYLCVPLLVSVLATFFSWLEKLSKPSFCCNMLLELINSD